MTWLNDVEHQSWGKDGGTFTGGPPKGVLHTTETTGWPGYSAGANAPHFTVYPDRAAQTLRIRQHSPLNKAARALRNESGGVQTNRDSAIQIELIGTCNPAWRSNGSYYYWPDADGWALDQLGTFMRRLESLCGIPRVAVGAWLGYPASYGNTSVRMTLSQWDNFTGWCGHQHVPENTHGDPGNIDIARLMGADTVVIPAPPAYRPPPPPTVGAPTFPLPAGHYFGPKSGPASSHSGYYSASDRASLRQWQAQMRARGWSIGVDGLYGDETARVARKFQAEKGLGVDGLIGRATWAAAWTAPVT